MLLLWKPWREPYSAVHSSFIPMLVISVPHESPTTAVYLFLIEFSELCFQNAAKFRSGRRIFYTPVSGVEDI